MGTGHSRVSEYPSPLARPPAELADASSGAKNPFGSSDSSFPKKTSTCLTGSTNLSMLPSTVASHSASVIIKASEFSSEVATLLKQLSINWTVYVDKFDQISEIFLERLLTAPIRHNSTTKTPKPPLGNFLYKSALSHTTEDGSLIELNHATNSLPAFSRSGVSKLSMPLTQEKGPNIRDPPFSSNILPTLAQQRGFNPSLCPPKQEKNSPRLKKKTQLNPLSEVLPKDANTDLSYQSTTKDLQVKTTLSDFETSFSTYEPVTYSTNDDSIPISPELRIAILELGYSGVCYVMNTLAYLASDGCAERLITHPAPGKKSFPSVPSKPPSCTISRSTPAEFLNCARGGQFYSKNTARHNLDTIDSMNISRRYCLCSSSFSFPKVHEGFSRKPAALGSMGGCGMTVPHFRCIKNSSKSINTQVNTLEGLRFLCVQHPVYPGLNNLFKARSYNRSVLEFVNTRNSANSVPFSSILPSTSHQEKISFHSRDNFSCRDEVYALQRTHTQQRFPLSHQAQLLPNPDNASTTTGLTSFKLDQALGVGADCVKTVNPNAIDNPVSPHHGNIENVCSPGSCRDEVLEALCQVFAHLHLTERDLVVMIVSFIRSILDVQDYQQTLDQDHSFRSQSLHRHNAVALEGREDLGSTSCTQVTLDTHSVALKENNSQNETSDANSRNTKIPSASHDSDPLSNSNLWVITEKILHFYFAAHLLQAKKMLYFASGCVGTSLSGLMISTVSERESNTEATSRLNSHPERGRCTQSPNLSVAVRNRSRTNPSLSRDEHQNKSINLTGTVTAKIATPKLFDRFSMNGLSTSYEAFQWQSYAFFRRLSVLFNLPITSRCVKQIAAERETSPPRTFLHYPNLPGESQAPEMKLTRDITSKLKTRIATKDQSSNLGPTLFLDSNRSLKTQTSPLTFLPNAAAIATSPSPVDFSSSEISSSINFKTVKRHLSDLMVQKHSFVLHFSEYVGKGCEQISRKTSDRDIDHGRDCGVKVEIGPRTASFCGDSDLYSEAKDFASFQDVQVRQEETSYSRNATLPAINSDPKAFHGSKGPTYHRTPQNSFLKVDEQVGNDVSFSLRTRMMMLCQNYVYVFDAITTTFAILGTQQNLDNVALPSYLSTPIALLDMNRIISEDLYILSGPTDTETAMVHATRQIRGVSNNNSAKMSPFRDPSDRGATMGEKPDHSVINSTAPMLFSFAGSNSIDVDVFRVRNREGELCLLTLPIAQPPIVQVNGASTVGNFIDNASSSEAKMRLPDVESRHHPNKESLLSKRTATNHENSGQEGLWKNHEDLTLVPGSVPVAITVYPLRILYKGMLHHFLFQTVGMRAWWYMRLTELATICQSTARALEVAAARQSVYAFVRNRISYPVGPSAFECIDMLGVGAFGRVLLVQHKLTSKLFAMKIVRKTCFHGVRNVLEIRRECAILESLDCPYIMKIHACFQSDSRVYILLDYLPGSELLTHTQHATDHHFDEPTARFYIAELAIAVEHLRLHGIVHRDIKGDNLVLDVEGHVVLTDFGFAKKITLCKNSNTTQGESLTDCVIKQRTGCGTRAYIAPEVLNATVSGAEGYGLEVDWWSMGVVLFTLLTGCFPFLRKTEQETNKAITQSPLQFPTHVRLSKEAQNLLQMLLQKNPAQRITTLAQLKQDPFFDRFDWEACEKRQLSPPIFLHKDSYKTPASLAVASRRLKEAVLNALHLSNQRHPQQQPICSNGMGNTLSDTRYAKEFKHEKDEMLLLGLAFGSGVTPKPLELENDVFGHLYDNQEYFSSIRDVADEKCDFDSRGYIPEVLCNGTMSVAYCGLHCNNTLSTHNNVVESDEPLEITFSKARLYIEPHLDQHDKRNRELLSQRAFPHFRVLDTKPSETDQDAGIFCPLFNDYKEDHYGPLRYMPTTEAQIRPEWVNFSCASGTEEMVRWD